MKKLNCTICDCCRVVLNQPYVNVGFEDLCANCHAFIAKMYKKLNMALDQRNYWANVCEVELGDVDMAIGLQNERLNEII